MRTFRDLVVYQKSLDLVETIYEITKKFPKSEIYGLSNQLRRAVVSIPSNIAEGASRSSRKDYTKFLYTSFGSCSEVEVQIEIARRLGYFSQDEYHSIMEIQIEISKMLKSLIKKLNQVN